jgi:hypothetical protein
MSEGRILQIIRDGRRFTAQTKLQLPPGAEANLITLSEMAKIVREDAQFPDLKNFVFREVIGSEPGKSISEKIDIAYQFCRDQIIYEPEKDGYETIADLWSCFYALNAKHAQGDCAIKSVALATMLCYLNLKPFFVAIKQVPKVDWFNHVFVGVTANGKEIGLDPTPENFRPGQTLKSFQRINFHIFK